MNEKEKKPPTLAELMKSIRAGLEKINGGVSADRSHSVESHLRVTIRHLGFRPTETAETRATISDLAEQLESCLDSMEGAVPEKDEALIYQHVSSIASNVEAECGLKDVPQLKEVPANWKTRS